MLPWCQEDCRHETPRITRVQIADIAGKAIVVSLGEQEGKMWEDKDTRLRPKRDRSVALRDVRE